MTVTLAAVERELAVRVGPYRQETLNSDSHTATLFYVDALKSSIPLGGITDLYVLRRGLLADGTAVPGFVAGDRIRVAKEYTPDTGSVEVDRAYSTTPVEDEVVEFHHLHPANELRIAVQSGLRRCYFLDRPSFALTSAAAERNLTDLAGWITDPSQVYEVESAAAATTTVPRRARWWNAVGDGTGVLLQGTDAYPYSLLVTARRPHATWFIAAGDTDPDTHLEGPTDDADALFVDLDYAAAAAHIEAWKRFRPRLQEVARRDLQMSKKEAAEEFTRQAYKHFSPPRPRVQMGRFSAVSSANA